MASHLITIILKIPVLTNAQLKTLVDIYINLGSLCFGTIVLPAFFGQFLLYKFLTGLIVSLFIWYTALDISKKIK